MVTELEAFTGEDAEQEDDITLVVVGTASAQLLLRHSRSDARSWPICDTERRRQRAHRHRQGIGRRRGSGLEPARLERLKTAVGETVMNAIEHGNENRAELDVDVQVCANEESVSVLVSDRGGDRSIPEATVPDLEAKLAGEQTPRGWGLFLIEKMVDEVRSTNDGATHTIELVMNRKGVS